MTQSTRPTRPTPAPAGLDELHRLVSGNHHDPHSVLGPHPYEGAVTIRTLRPWATAVTIVVGDETIPMQHEEYGVWVGVVPDRERP